MKMIPTGWKLAADNNWSRALLLGNAYRVRKQSALVVG
jgi:hypothetical protein